ncbi:MAG: hypothetical protein FGM15_07925 [Chthoniobacterales bacterium]|nr:hypothetical protein [Chthoniobacterales bacterium]
MIATLLWFSSVFASEVQKHGLSFEHWVADVFFGGYRPQGPIAKWDIPASANTEHGGVPVNPKATKFGQPVGMGDALRQYDIDEPFLLIVGFWEQSGDEKKFVQSLVAHVTPQQWRNLWSPVKRADLETLDKLVRDTSMPIAEVRREVLRRKKEPPFSESVIQINPKIDKSQRRLQCSISYERLFKNLAPGSDGSRLESAEIFGRVIAGIATSPPRDLP